MVAHTISIPRLLPTGEAVAANVSEDDFMLHYAGQYYEWVEGVVIKMSPVSFRHDQIVAYLRRFFETYFALKPIGLITGEPFVMRLEHEGRVTRREPDLQVILNDNPHTRHDTYMDGPADICIEVVSPGSVSIDYGEKLEEYERSAVAEYWLIDPERRVCLFYRLTVEGRYTLIQPDAHGTYITPLLPSVEIRVPILWQESLPDILKTVDAVRTMLGA